MSGLLKVLLLDGRLYTPSYEGHYPVYGRIILKEKSEMQDSGIGNDVTESRSCRSNNMMQEPDWRAYLDLRMIRKKGSFGEVFS